MYIYIPIIELECNHNFPINELKFNWKLGIKNHVPPFIKT